MKTTRTSKQRHNPDKPANNRNPHCPYYETIDGKSYCSGIHTGNVPTNPKCEGNIYNCVKVQYQQFATIK